MIMTMGNHPSGVEIVAVQEHGENHVASGIVVVISPIPHRLLCRD